MNIPEEQLNEIIKLRDEIYEHELSITKMKYEHNINKSYLEEIEKDTNETGLIEALEKFHIMHVNEIKEDINKTKLRIKQIIGYYKK